MTREEALDICMDILSEYAPVSPKFTRPVRREALHAIFDELEEQGALTLGDEPYDEDFDGSHHEGESTPDLTDLIK
jgi:hypothetical protein